MKNPNLNNLEHSFLELSKDLMCVAELDGFCKYVNPAFKKLLGYTERELLSKPFLDFIHPDDHLKTNGAISDLFKGKLLLDIENRLICKDGSIKSIHWTASPKVDEKVMHFVGRDITYKKQVECELRASEEKYKQLFVKLMNAFALHEMIFNENGEPTDYKFLEVNPTWEKIVGIKAETVINKTIHEIMPDIEDRWIQTYGRVVKTGIPEEFEDYNVATQKYYHIYAYRTEPGRFAVLFNDMTADKLVEESLIRAKEKAEKSEEQLKRSEYVLNEAQKISKIGGWEYNVESRETYFSDEVFNIYGVPNDKMFKVEEGIGFYHPDDRHLVSDSFTKIVSKGIPYDLDVRFINAQGENMWVSTAGIPVFKNGKVVKVLGTLKDITKQKRIENELTIAKEKAEESEETIRQIFENSTIVHYSHDLNHVVSYVSPQVENILGYTPEEIKVKWTTLASDNPINEKAFRSTTRAIETGEKQAAYQLEFVHKNGKKVLVEAHEAPVVKDGKTIFIVGSFADITERKKTETELLKAKEKAEESENKFKAAFYTNPDAVNINKMDGEYVEINEGFTCLTGYTIDDVIGKRSSEINIWSIPKDREKLLDALQKFGIIENLESIFRAKDGRLIPALMSAKIIILNNEPHILSVTRDIAERKKLEKTKDVLFAISNKILTTNDLEEFFHHIFIELREIVDTNNFYIALYDDQSKMISTPYIADRLDTSIKTFPAKNTMTGHVIKTQKSMLINQTDFHELVKSGAVDLIGPPSDVWIGVPLFSGDKVIGVIVIQNYKGEKRLSREDLRVLEYVAPQISLAIERKKVVEDLKYALGRAQESDRLKSAFLANMSHEIRTPMNGILGFTELLKEPGLSGKEQQKYIGIIESSGDRMLSTIHDIIDISKIEAGQVKLSFSYVNLSEQLEELFEFFLPEAEKKNIQLSVSKALAVKNATIKTDRDKLNSILTNLIKNAIKFTSSGKIEFGYLINEKVEQPELQFFVKDTGAGIPKGKQNAVFNRFVQADNESSRVYEGSGLGLAISKAYVEMLKGEIWLESEEGVGTHFYFSHPYQIKENHKKNIANLSKANTEKKALKVLIAEDEKFAVDFLSIILKDYCKEILIAKTGLEAVEMCRKNSDLDLIMMDIRLPEISGFEATKRIRKFNKDVFILAQTAFALAGDEEKCKAMGCDDYITKPIKKEKLFKIISESL